MENWEGMRLAGCPLLTGVLLAGCANGAGIDTDLVDRWQEQQPFRNQQAGGGTGDMEEGMLDTQYRSVSMERHNLIRDDVVLEVADYFAGVKTLDQVVDVIGRRFRMYEAERQ